MTLDLCACFGFVLSGSHKGFHCSPEVPIHMRVAAPAQYKMPSTILRSTLQLWLRRRIAQMELLSSPTVLLIVGFFIDRNIVSNSLRSESASFTPNFSLFPSLVSQQKHVLQDLSQLFKRRDSGVWCQTTWKDLLTKRGPLDTRQVSLNHFSGAQIAKSVTADRTEKHEPFYFTTVSSPGISSINRLVFSRSVSLTAMQNVNRSQEMHRKVYHICRGHRQLVYILFERSLKAGYDGC